MHFCENEIDQHRLNSVFEKGLCFYSHISGFHERFLELYCSKQKSIFDRVTSSTLRSLQHDHDQNEQGRYQINAKQCEVLVDFSWENINIGHWKDVDIFWRQLYRAASFIRSVNLYLAGSVSDGIKSCDMGLIMGAPIDKELFIQEVADIISQKFNNMCIKNKKPTKSHNFPVPRFYNYKEIPSFDSPSLQQFMELIIPGTPFVMKNVISHWPALKKWSPSYLVAKHGCRTVPVELGSSYTSDRWSQKLMTLNDYISTYISTKSDDIAYLAQYELFNHITKLKEDISPLDYCAVSDSEVVTNCWFGPEGTVSPLHHDHYQNLFCQVYGYKRFIMYDSSENMHPHQHHLLNNTSQVDIESPSVMEDFPDMKDKIAWVVEMGPGDVLYLPLHWWHHVRSLSVSFSVSFWWK